MSTVEEFVYLFKAEGDKDVSSKVKSLKEEYKELTAAVKEYTASQKKASKEETLAIKNQIKIDSARFSAEEKKRRDEAKTAALNELSVLRKKQAEERFANNEKRKQLSWEKREEERKIRAQEKINKGIGNQNNLMIKAISIALAYKAASFYTNAVQEAKQIDIISTSAGMASEKIQSMALAAKRFGGSFETVSKTVTNLNNRIQQWKMGLGVGETLAQVTPIAGTQFFDLSTVRDAEDFLVKTAKVMESMRDERQKFLLGRTLGIDEATIQMMIGGASNFQSLISQRQGTIAYTDRGKEALSDLYDTFLDISDLLKRNVVNGLLEATPVFKEILDTIKMIMGSDTTKKTMQIAGGSIRDVWENSIKGVGRTFASLMSMSDEESRFADDFIAVAAGEKTSSQKIQRAKDFLSSVPDQAQMASSLISNVDNRTSNMTTTFNQTNNITSSNSNEIMSQLNNVTLNAITQVSRETQRGRQ